MGLQSQGSLNRSQPFILELQEGSCSYAFPEILHEAEHEMEIMKRC